MTVAVRFPDAMLAAISLVASSVTTDVSSRVPVDRPEQFVRIRRTGGVRADLISDGALLLVETWAATEDAAMALAEDVRVAFQQARGTFVAGMRVYTVTEVAGPALFPDPLSAQPRVTFTVELRVRGSAGTQEIQEP